MDLWMYGQYRRGHGTEPLLEWEFSASVTDWDKAAAPGQVGRRIVEALYEVKLPDSRAALTNNVMHWGYSVAAAVGYTMVVTSLRKPRTGYGLIFGAGLWGLSYAILTPMHLYKRITEYDAKTLGKDLLAHLVFGMGTAATLSLLLSRRGRRA
jgi:uncharacterized membrane protein YagU involved in acid resistance